MEVAPKYWISYQLLKKVANKILNEVGVFLQNGPKIVSFFTFFKVLELIFVYVLK